MPILDIERIPADSLTFQNDVYQVYWSSVREDPLPMLDYLGIEITDSFCAQFYLTSPAEGHYKIQSAQLYLTELNLLCPIQQPYPEIDGAKPVKNQYKGLFMRLPFTGKITIGQPFKPIEDDIFAYEVVKSVRCKGGEIKGIEDMTNYLQEIQNRKERLWQEYEEKNAHRKGKDERLLKMYQQYSQEIDSEWRTRLFGFESN